MFRSARRAFVLYGLATLVAMAALHQDATPVLADDCTAVDQYGLPRDCTFLEEFGQCLWNAMDSLDTCLAAATGWFSSGLCWAGYEVDFYACLPSELLEQVFI